MKIVFYFAVRDQKISCILWAYCAANKYFDMFLNKQQLVHSGTLSHSKSDPDAIRCRTVCQILCAPPLVLADTATAAVFAPAPPPLLLAEAAATAVFACAPLPLVLAEAAATAVFTPAPHPLVLAQAAAAAVFALAPLPLVLTEAAAAAVFAPAPLPLVLTKAAATEHRGLAGLLGCRRIQRRSCDQVR